MNPTDAYKNVAHACSKFMGTFADHQALQQSLAVLAKLVSDAENSAQQKEQQAV